MASARQSLVALAALGMVLLVSPSPAAEQPREFLFVQTAATAGFDGDRLRLEGIGPVTTYFSDRPNRLVGQLSQVAFIEAWRGAADSFAKAPPNASLAFADAGNEVVAVVELRNPVLTGSRIAYEVKVLAGALPTKFGPVSVFIDGGGLMQLVAYGGQ